MRVALITEGVSEFKSLPMLYPQLQARSGNILFSPLKVNVPPTAAPRIIARECRSRLLIAQAKGANIAVIVLDREDREECAGLIATEVGQAASASCHALPVKVVLKDRTFENWLIADLEALRKRPARFQVSKGAVRRVEPGKADRCDGYSILTSCIKGDRYEKVRDSQAICSNMDVTAVARHSRSFRHFLHMLGDPMYATQCRRV